MFAKFSDIKKKLWEWELWWNGFYVVTVNAHGDEEVIARYVKNQENEYNNISGNRGRKAVKFFGLQVGEGTQNSDIPLSRTSGLRRKASIWNVKVRM